MAVMYNWFVLKGKFVMTGNEKFALYADSTFTVEDIDHTPSYTGINTLQFDQADGYVITQPSAGIARLDFVTNLIVEELDGSPSVAHVGKVQFDQDNGFVVSQPTAGTALVRFTGYPLTVKELDGSPIVSPVTTIGFDQAAGFVVSGGGGEADITFTLPATTAASVYVGNITPANTGSTSTAKAQTIYAVDPILAHQPAGGEPANSNTLSIRKPVYYNEAYSGDPLEITDTYVTYQTFDLDPGVWHVVVEAATWIEIQSRLPPAADTAWITVRLVNHTASDTELRKMVANHVTSVYQHYNTGYSATVNAGPPITVDVSETGTSSELYMSSVRQSTMSYIVDISAASTFYLQVKINLSSGDVIIVTSQIGNGVGSSSGVTYVTAHECPYSLP